MSKILRQIATTLIFSAALMTGNIAMADTDAEKLATVKEMFAAWDNLQWDKAFSLFAEDGVLHSVMKEPVVGRAAIAKHLQPMAKGAEKIDLQVQNMGIINGLVFVERIDDFTFNGHHGRVPVVGVIKVEGGKIKEWKEYYDHNQLMTEMGLAK